MNRRTAEQGTAEYRREKHFLILYQKLLLFEIPCSIFDIQNIKLVLGQLLSGDF